VKLSGAFSTNAGCKSGWAGCLVLLDQPQGHKGLNDAVHSCVRFLDALADVSGERVGMSRWVLQNPQP
jgi:hypothetical protein